MATGVPPSRGGPYLMMLPHMRPCLRFAAGRPESAPAHRKAAGPRVGPPPLRDDPTRHPTAGHNRSERARTSGRQGKPRRIACRHDHHRMLVIVSSRRSQDADDSPLGAPRPDRQCSNPDRQCSDSDRQFSRCDRQCSMQHQESSPPRAHTRHGGSAVTEGWHTHHVTVARSTRSAARSIGGRTRSIRRAARSIRGRSPACCPARRGGPGPRTARRRPAGPCARCRAGRRSARRGGR